MVSGVASLHYPSAALFLSRDNVEEVFFTSTYMYAAVMLPAWTDICGNG